MSNNNSAIGPNDVDIEIAGTSTPKDPRAEKLKKLKEQYATEAAKIEKKKADAITDNAYYEELDKAREEGRKAVSEARGDTFLTRQQERLAKLVPESIRNKLPKETIGDKFRQAARYTGINKAADAASSLTGKAADAASSLTGKAANAASSVTGKAANVALRGTKLLASPITAPVGYLYNNTKKLFSSNNSSTNSGTQKNKVGSTGPGKKITITFIQDDRNQCFIKDYNLCSVTNIANELSNVYDDKLVIDGNNRPVKKNIQNIGKNQQATYGCNGQVPVATTDKDTTNTNDNDAEPINADINGEAIKAETTANDANDANDANKTNDNATTIAANEVDNKTTNITELPPPPNDKGLKNNKIIDRVRKVFNAPKQYPGGYNSSKSITRRKNAKPMSKRLLRYSRRSRNSKKL